MDRSLQQELELRSLLRDLTTAEQKATQLWAQSKQFKVNVNAKVDARLYHVESLKAKIAADQMEQTCRLLESRMRAATKGANSRIVSQNGPSAIPGLAASCRDRARKLVTDMQGIKRDLDEAFEQTTREMNDPMRASAGAAMAFDVGGWVLTFNGLLSWLDRILMIVKAL